MKRIPIFLLTLLIPFSGAYTQTNLMDIIKSQSRIAGDLNNPFEGFGRKISGEDIVYHSTRQDCQNALLVRATDGTMNISWETPLINLNPAAKEVQLFLIAGMSLQGYDIKGVDPGFQVFINEKPFLHFNNSMGENWTANGPDGSRMIFQTVLKDQANDAFGYARIVLPASFLEGSKPIIIKIQGDSAGSRHWFMIFQCVDALDWFLKKTSIEGWFDVQLTQVDGKLNGLLVAPETWTGQSVEISGTSGK